MTWLKQMSPFIVVSSILGLAMALFIMIPVFAALTNSAGDLQNALMSPLVTNAIFMSFYCAMLATLFIFVLGVPFAYVLSRYEFPGKKAVNSLIDLPILIPHNAAGLALVLVLGRAYPIGSFFNSFGIGFQDTIFGIVAAMAFVSCPFMIRSAQEAFSAVNPAMERTARSLGASNFKVFVHVTFPLSTRGILTGCLLTWGRAVAEFGAVVVLAEYPMTAPVLVNYLLGEPSLGGLSAALAVTGLLIITAIVVLVIFRIVTSKSTRPVY
jgi:molybdate/tungstate transport system permease protein